MADEPTDGDLRDMARHQGLRLVKSRRRKPGGDFGRYGLTDAAGDPLFGHGDDGLSATAAEVAGYLRKRMAATWAASDAATPGNPHPVASAKPEPVTPPPPPKPAAAKPKPKPKPTPAPPPLIVRPARRSDGPALLKLLKPFGDVPTLDTLVDRLTTLAHDGAVLVADQAGLVGCVSWQVVTALTGPSRGWITLIAVAEPARHRGIGRAMIDAAIGALDDQDIGLVEVAAAIDDGAARFLRAAGFQAAGSRFTRS